MGSALDTRLLSMASKEAIVVPRAPEGTRDGLPRAAASTVAPVSPPEPLDAADPEVPLTDNDVSEESGVPDVATDCSDAIA